MNKTEIIILVIVIIILVAIGIWYGAIKKLTPVLEAKKPIKIGAIYSLTGPLGNFGEQFQEGIAFAVNVINKKGGINGKKLKLLLEDNQSDKEKTISAFYKLVEIDTVKYLFSFGSSINLSLKPIAEEKRVILFADVVDPAITNKTNFILRHSNIASFDAKTLIEEVKKKNPNNVGIIYANDDFNVRFIQEIQKLLKEVNPTIKVIKKNNLPTNTNFRTQLAEILDIKPDVVLIASFGRASGFIIKQLKELGCKGDIFANVGFAFSADAQKIAGEAAKGIYYQTFKESSAYNQDFFAKYNKEPKGLFSMPVYLDIELLKEAIEKVGENPADVARYIKGLGTFKGTYETAQVLPSGDIIIPTEIRIWQQIKQPDNPPNSKTGLKICPDEWIDNQMPSDSSDKLQRQYFILNGERREFEEFDVAWVQKSCNLTKQVVY